MVPFGFILLVAVAPLCRGAEFSFIREPESEIIEDGHAIFMCEPSQGFATVQWFRDDQELSANSSNVVKISTCGRMHSLEVLETKRSKYRCVIGMKKSPLKLMSKTVEAIPIAIDEFNSLNTSDRRIEVSQGSTAIIPCGPLPRSEPPAVPNVHILKKRKRIVLKLGHRFQVMRSGNVFVRNAQPKDSGEYQCFAENPLTGERREAPFKVHLHVRSQDGEQSQRRNASLVHGPPPRTEAIIGSNVTMECLGDGIPKPQIQWKRMDPSYLPEGRIEGENTLTLLSVTPKHAGVYECLVSNYVTVRARSTLVVLEPPRLKQPEKITYVVENGQSLNLECELSRGEPQPNITWVLNAERLRSHSGRSIFVSEREVFIRKITKQFHEGAYQCFATNSLGSASIQYQVQVISAASQDEAGLSAQDFGRDRENSPSQSRTEDKIRLPSPSKPDIQQISSSAVLITWLVDPAELSVSFFKVQYMVRGGGWETLDVEVNPWQTAYQVDGLQQPLQYRFRLIAVYENDDHRISKASRWVALVEMPEPKRNETPQLTPIVSVSSDSPTSLTVQWKLETQSGDIVDGFILKFRRIDSAGEWTIHRQPRNASRSFTIEHLKAGQHYEVKMAAFNQFGVGNFSTARVARTRDAPTRSPPSVKLVPHDDEQDKLHRNDNGNLGKEMPQRTAFQKHHLIAIAVIGATLGIISLVCLVCAIQYGRNSSGRPSKVDKRLRREAAAYVNDANLNFTPSISTVDLASNSPNSKRFDDDDLTTDDSEDSGSESMKSVSHEEVPRSEKEYALRILTQLYATNGHIVNFDTQSSRVHSV
ncbi:cell adhesion molecule-related/down-regulated by oncogenes-like [Galendromus occidentalis]|uniref:Cell adhesion molecule-related/down-regulated by oncogenes-like n=1 Tax=Galendromus occidentalis TaxID=34638 RepID=A0AAJ6QW17_9ACAR|nr:cell adhesion molecule-related/down-regulated by oncogenes-like [Galendromus occidentalis]